MNYVKMSNLSLSDVEDPYVLKLVTEIGELIKDEFSETMIMKMEDKDVEIPKLYLDGEEHDSVGTVAFNYLKEKSSSQQRIIFKNIKRLTEPTIPDLFLDDDKIIHPFLPQLSNYSPVDKYTVDRRFLLKPKLPQFPTLEKNNNHIINRIDLKKKFALLGDVKVIERIKVYLARLIEQTTIECDDEEEENTNDTPYLNKGLNFNLIRVKCYDETGSGYWQELGEDEIYMGGTAVDEFEKSAMINEFKVGNFDDGETKRYRPSKVLHSFPLNDDYSNDVTEDEKGKLFTVFLGLAEQDNGGFGSFLSKLYQSVKKEIEVILKYLSTAIGGAIGAAIGGTIGTALGGPIGGALGLLAGLAIDYAINSIVNAFNDDIFKPKIATLFLPSADTTFDRSLKSPIQTFDYKGHNAHYRAYYQWGLER
ncbi:hypothetical protein [Halobacillus litoralis]|uniref:hypothetical protein n=1 Tax=Halobacillus litoralis TaxID=45668 RepID=UPI001CFD1682|nr:hypothetical protein [Halobacillus litoralis]